MPRIEKRNTFQISITTFVCTNDRKFVLICTTKNFTTAAEIMSRIIIIYLYGFAICEILQMFVVR